MQNGEKINLVCMVKGVKIHTDKSGKRMCFLRLEDESGEIDSTVFSDVYRKSEQELSNNSVLLIKAHLSSRNGNPGIICDEIFNAEKDIQEIISGMNFCIKLDSGELEVFRRIEKVLADHKGNSRVLIYLTDMKKMISPKTPLYVSADKNLLDSLKQYVSYDRIGLVKRQ